MAPRLTVAQIPFVPFSPLMGGAIGGISEYDLTRQFIVGIVSADKTINLDAPAAHQSAGAGVRLPLKFIDGKPFSAALTTPDGTELRW